MKLNHGFDRISACPDCRVEAAGVFDAGLSEKAKADFARAVQARSCAPGDVLFEEGSAPKGVFLIEGGSVKLVRRADARPQVVKIARRGDVLGLGATLTRAPHRVTAEVLAETQAGFLSVAEFHRFLKRHPMFIGRLVAYIEDHAHGERSPFTLTSASRKVAQFLLQSALQDGHETSEGTRIDLHVTLGELSSLLFVRTERLEDVFERFEDRHWIYRGQRTVTLLDEPALQAISHGSVAGQQR
jgi:CRP/FNR family transcriptional regulator